MSCPLVSVIIPLYNAEQFLKETVTSVLNQTYSNIEIIIIDDYSTDSSYEKALEFQNQNVIVRQNKDKGACAARNYGFELSSGDYIQYLDADDLLSPDKIERQVSSLEMNKNKLAVCNTYHFYNNILDSFNTDKDYIYTTNDTVSFLINLLGGSGKPHYVAVHSWLTPRNLILKVGSWDETLFKDQDGEFFCRIVLASEGIIYVSQCCSYYRKHQTGNNIASLGKQKHLQSQLHSLISKENQLASRTDSISFHKAMALQYKNIAINAWPQYKQITYNALEKCAYNGGSIYLPILGGRIIEIIKCIFGWKVARSLSFWIHNSKIITHLRK